MRTTKLILALLILLQAVLFAQQYGDPTFRKSGIHSGNKVRTVFFNYGLVAGTVGTAIKR